MCTLILRHAGWRQLRGVNARWTLLQDGGPRSTRSVTTSCFALQEHAQPAAREHSTGREFTLAELCGVMKVLGCDGNARVRTTHHPTARCAVK